jgi:hypothetical protein
VDNSQPSGSRSTSVTCARRCDLRALFRSRLAPPRAATKQARLLMVAENGTQDRLLRVQPQHSLNTHRRTHTWLSTSISVCACVTILSCRLWLGIQKGCSVMALRGVIRSS